MEKRQEQPESADTLSRPRLEAYLAVHSSREPPESSALLNTELTRTKLPKPQHDLRGCDTERLKGGSTLPISPPTLHRCDKQAHTAHCHMATALAPLPWARGQRSGLLQPRRTLLARARDPALSHSGHCSLSPACGHRQGLFLLFLKQHIRLGARWADAQVGCARVEGEPILGDDLEPSLGTEVSPTPVLWVAPMPAYRTLLHSSTPNPTQPQSQAPNSKQRDPAHSSKTWGQLPAAAGQGGQGQNARDLQLRPTASQTPEEGPVLLSCPQLPANHASTSLGHPPQHTRT